MITIFQSEWPSLKSLQTINAGGSVEKGSPLALLVGMQTDIIIMEKSMDIPLKTRNKTNIWVFPVHQA